MSCKFNCVCLFAFEFAAQVLSKSPSIPAKWVFCAAVVVVTHSHAFGLIFNIDIIIAIIIRKMQRKKKQQKAFDGMPEMGSIACIFAILLLYCHFQIYIYNGRFAGNQRR